MLVEKDLQWLFQTVKSRQHVGWLVGYYGSDRKTSSFLFQIALPTLVLARAARHTMWPSCRLPHPTLPCPHDSGDPPPPVPPRDGGG